MNSHVDTYRETGPTNGYEFSGGSGYDLPEYPFEAPPELQGDPLVRHTVVIVGGGLTGLTLACSLARYGVASVLIDEEYAELAVRTLHSCYGLDKN